MCGRYSLICTDDLGNRFRVWQPTIGCRSRFNVAPSQVMPVVVQREQTELVPMEWGLVPHWVKDPTTAHRPINARAETLTERPMFRGLIRHNRCLVPASGFYEWKKADGHKLPYYLRLKDEDLFAFAVSTTSGMTSMARPSPRTRSSPRPRTRPWPRSTTACP